jgi:DNA uptake protein ComE-like DNA-binding protein
MTRHRITTSLFAAALVAGAVVAAPVRAQVGQGLLDVNTASEQQITALPHMTPAVVKGMMDKRPFMSIVDLNTYLAGAGLTAEQAAAVYSKAFIHVNLNSGTAEEIMLIPGAGKRMAHEFEEYRPWRSWAQFDREIGKYVDEAEVNRLKQYVFIPVNLNTASDEDILSIPGAGRRMVREFKEYRPWTSKAQFEKEIGKYVDAKEVARLWRYVVIQ